MDEHTVVVAGGGYAGVLAANRLRGKLNRDARIVMIAPSSHFIDRIRLHQAAAVGRDVRRPYASLLAPGVEHVAGSVVGLDPERKQVRWRAGAESEALRYAALILALGSRVRPMLPCTSAHAAALSDADAALRLAAELKTLPPGSRCAIVGGGLTGIELAAEIADAHPRLSVELIAREVAEDLAGPARDALLTGLRRLGVHLRQGCGVQALTPEGVQLEDGSLLAAAVSVLAAGFEAAPLGPQFGIATRDDGRIQVDAQLRVPGLNDVFAAGDLAAPPSTAVGSGRATTRMACATSMPLGAHAADQVARRLAGAPPKDFRFVYALRCISLGRTDGVVAFVDGDDRPTGRVIRGSGAALIKESICRFVIGSLRVERMLAGAYAWPRGPKPSAAERASQLSA